MSRQACIEPDAENPHLKMQENTAAILLAGAHAWGESVFDPICFRALLPMAGAALVRHALNWVWSADVKDCFVCANSATRSLRRILGDGKGLETRIEFHEDSMPRGPAGCARDAALKCKARVFVIADATIVSHLDLGRVLQAHDERRATVTVVASPAAAAQKGTNGVLEPVGICVANREALELVPERGYQDIKEGWLPLLYQRGKGALPYVIPKEASVRVRGLHSYLAAMALFIGQRNDDYWKALNYRRCGNSWAHASARVENDVQLIGPVVIGPRSEIASRTTIIGPTTIGADCRIDRATIVNRSAIWSNCSVSSESIIDHCVLVHGLQNGPGLVIRDQVCASVHNAIDTSNLYWAVPSISCEAKYQPVELCFPGNRLTRTARAGHTHDNVRTRSARPRLRQALSRLDPRS